MLVIGPAPELVAPELVAAVLERGILVTVLARWLAEHSAGVRRLVAVSGELDDAVRARIPSRLVPRRDAAGRARYA